MLEELIAVVPPTQGGRDGTESLRVFQLGAFLVVLTGPLPSGATVINCLSLSP